MDQLTSELNALNNKISVINNEFNDKNRQLTESLKMVEQHKISLEKIFAERNRLQCDLRRVLDEIWKIDQSEMDTMASIPIFSEKVIKAPSEEANMVHSDVNCQSTSSTIEEKNVTKRKRKVLSTAKPKRTCPLDDTKSRSTENDEVESNKENSVENATSCLSDPPILNLQRKPKTKNKQWAKMSIYKKKRKSIINKAVDRSRISSCGDDHVCDIKKELSEPPMSPTEEMEAKSSDGSLIKKKRSKSMSLIEQKRHSLADISTGKGKCGGSSTGISKYAGITGADIIRINYKNFGILVCGTKGLLAFLKDGVMTRFEGHKDTDVTCVEMTMKSRKPIIISCSGNMLLIHSMESAEIIHEERFDNDILSMDMYTNRLKIAVRLIGVYDFLVPTFTSKLMYSDDRLTRGHISALSEGVCALSIENDVYLLSTNGKVIKKYSFDSEITRIRRGSDCVLAATKHDLHLFSNKGGPVESHKFEDEIMDISLNATTFIVAFDNRSIHRCNLTGEKKRFGTFVEFCKSPSDVTSLGIGEKLLLISTKAEIFICV